MVFAVARATARKAANAITHHGGHNGPGQAARSKLHGGTQIRHASTTSPPLNGSNPCPPKPPRSPSYKLFTQSRNLLARVFTQLTAPGFRAPTCISNGGAGAARSLHSGAAPTIKSGLSFHARSALSSGSRNIHLPRPPAPGVRIATNLGLGTARNFSTARPIFQNLVDNVPVIGRAFYEADLDLKKGSAMKRARMRKGKKPYTVKGKAKEMLKPMQAVIKTRSQSEIEDDMAHYFRNAVPPVNTYLFIPLAPTPSSRVPLPADPILSSNPPGLLPPLSEFGSFHASYDAHRARVTSLFLRLDQADVWSRGATCSPYGQVGEGAGVCTIIALEFIGWTETEVRSVIGESGTGWCALKEVRSDDADELSDLSSLVDPSDVEVAGTTFPGYIEPSSSFIMPTLDFSSSFLDSGTPVSPSLKSVSLASSQISSRSSSSEPEDLFAAALDTEYDDPWADGSSDMSDYSDIDPPSENGWHDIGSERSWQSPGALVFSAQHWSG